MNYLTTFYTHYGAMRFHKYCLSSGVPAKMKPVPRELSASCGVCVLQATTEPPKIAEHEDMEGVYKITPEGAYILIEESTLK